MDETRASVEALIELAAMLQERPTVAQGATAET